MPKAFLFLLLFTLLQSRSFSQTYPSLNLTLLSHFDPETDTTGEDVRKYSSCWGWYQASKNKEYAIIGSSAKTYFIDVTNPRIPVIVDSVMAVRKGCTWREIKTYQNYCYIVSDDSKPNTFQIVDMQYLPDSVHVVYNDSTYFIRSHTIFVDKDNLYCGAVTTKEGFFDNMRVYNLANPEVPVLMRVLNQDYPTVNFAHDMYVRNDTVYASCGNQGFLVFRYNGPTTPFSSLAVYTNYVQTGYNHSSWQTDDHKTMVFTDEVPAGLCAKVIDVQNFNNITLLDTIRSHYGATAHNPYILGNNWCWIASYQDGLYLYDISKPSDTKIYAYFDTYPQHGTNDNFITSAYRGNWGAYPFLPSKIIIATDMQNGIFILEGDSYYKTGIKQMPESDFNCYPNPTTDELFLLIANHTGESINYTIYNALGQKVEEKNIYIDSELFQTFINTSNLAAGYYCFSFKLKDTLKTKKILIQK